MTPETLKEIFAQYMPTTLIYLMRYVGVDNDGNTVERFFTPNYEPIQSNGTVYQPAAFRISLGKDSSEGMPTVRLNYDGGDRQVVNELRVFNEAPKIYVSVVVAERPDTVEIAEVEFEIENWTVSDNAIQAQLITEPVLNEPIPGDRITPQLFPLLWENVTVKDVAV